MVLFFLSPCLWSGARGTRSERSQHPCRRRRTTDPACAALYSLRARFGEDFGRNTASNSLPPLVSKDLPIDFGAREVSGGDRTEHLTPKEYDALKPLVANLEKLLTHRRLLQGVWGRDYGKEPDSL